MTCGESTCGGPGYGVSTVSYVGAGMGDYTQETTYRFVGYGAGEYAAIQVPQGRQNIFICICVPLVLLFVVIPLVYFAFSSSSYPNGGTKPMPIDNLGLYFEYIVLPVVVLLAIGVPLYCFFSRPGGQINYCICIAVPLLVIVPLFYLMFASSSQHGPYYGKGGDNGEAHAFGSLPPWLETYCEFILLPAALILVVVVPMFFCFSGACAGMQMNNTIVFVVAPVLVIIPVCIYFVFASSVYHPHASPY
jgi:hypothetical protein